MEIPCTGRRRETVFAVARPQAGKGQVADASLSRDRLLRREAAVKRLVLRGHVDQELRRCEPRTVFPLELQAQFDERLRAHEIDVGQRAAGEWREAEAEDRTYVRLARIGDDMILHGARGFHRLYYEE